ncbi:lysylphosphatidylglycerol synthase transmembrane domain-containing protein [Halococcus agarilyticus]|uniref:lysylphosphatidylglycerol synthase transmembrane domain-containing protein n=1 Tax=Halococcus agarilyticus TaxID=1232219 RepID=UPI0006779768|nr:lysylphosphatidylglycerol synthase transmembrane domain-containing protein [Halococcus agarilyticus]
MAEYREASGDRPGGADPGDDADDQSGRLRRWVSEHGVQATAVLTLVVFGALFLYADAGAVVDAFSRFEWPAFAAVIGLTTVGYAFRFGKWEFYLRELGVDIPLKTSLTVFFSGLMMVVTPGKAGEVWKAWLLRDMEGTPASLTTSVVGAERVTDLISLSMLAGVGVVAYGRSPAVLIALAVAFAAGIGLLQWRAGCLRLLDAAASLPVVGQYATSLERFYESTYALFRLRPLSVATLLGIVAWGLEGVALWIVLAGFGVEAALLVGVFVFALGSVIGAVSMLPGGLGAAEASMAGLLLTFGIAESVAAGATMVIRVGTLWYAAVLGFVVFSVHKYRADESGPDV